MPSLQQAPTIQRCAIYTRKSVDQGLDKEFNSLETQRAICSAYITSQAHKGWREIPTRYDDGGQSGATLDRPNLLALLADIDAGLVDLVVVYKLDRITRSLLHFVRLMEMFERRRIALVSITQMFDSSDSMGRLILNVLLTFAQFEREIAADRMRDKQRIVRQTGRWFGGQTPLGYHVRKQILQIDHEDAEKVRFIFRRYVELGTVTAVARECEARHIFSRRFKSKSGRWLGGTKLGENSIRYVLDNPAYIGLLRVGDELVPALHQPIVEQPLWDRAQELRRVTRRRRLQSGNNLLSHLLKDCFGRSMSVMNRGGPNYYVSNVNTTRGRVQNKGLRIRKDVAEHLVCSALSDLLGDKERLRAGLLRLGCYAKCLEELCRAADIAALKLDRLPFCDLQSVIRSVFPHIEVGVANFRIVLNWRGLEHYLEWDGIGTFAPGSTESLKGTTELVEIPCCRTHRTVLAAPVDPRGEGNDQPSASLLRLLASAREAQTVMETNRSLGMNALAAKLDRTRDHFIRLLRLNYLAPDIVASILDGTQPKDLTARKLLHWDLPLDWALQRQVLGFPVRASFQGF